MEGSSPTGLDPSFCTLFTGVRGRGILRSPLAGSCIVPVLSAENARYARPWPEGRYLYIVVSHKDTLACMGKGRRRWAISIDGKGHRIGALGGLAGAGTGTRPGVRAVTTLAAKFRGSKLARLCILCKPDSEGASLLSYDGPVMFEPDAERNQHDAQKTVNQRLCPPKLAFGSS